MIKLIAIDMDGTLLKSDHTVSERTKKTLQAARQKGIQVVICTGRPYPGIVPYITDLGLEDDYVITYNGALVQHTGAGDVLIEETLTMKDLAIVEENATKMGVNFHAINLEAIHVLTDTISEFSYYESNLVNMPIKQCKYHELDPSMRFNKIMYVDQPEVLDRLIASFPSEMHECYTLLRSNPVFLEVVHKNASKGSAVQKLAKRLGIDQAQVMCIGDNENDRDMIEYAGIGVAMGNAVSAIQEIADVVTLDCDHDGVASAIERYALQENVVVKMD